MTALNGIVDRTRAFLGTPPNPWKVLGVYFFVTFAVASLGGLVTRPSVQAWYDSLSKPFFVPPNWAFAPAWSIMFVLMAVAAWMVWRAVGWEDSRKAMILWASQLGLNFLWSLLFFGFKAIGLALVESFLFLGVVYWTYVEFKKADKTAGNLMLPVVIWVAYATLLNAGVLWEN